MKNGLKYLHFGTLWLLGAIVSFNSCSQSPTSDEGVIINGVKWATRNVDAPGTFASKPEDFGMFYQWNRIKAWAATGDVTDWDESYPVGDTWEKVNDPSPAGWRVPTLDEIQKLLDTDKVDYRWTTTFITGVKGHKFTDRATKKSIFIPAAGFRDGIDGGRLSNTWSGLYWSATAGGNGAYYFSISSGHFGLIWKDSENAKWNSCNSRNGLLVRAVAE